VPKKKGKDLGSLKMGTPAPVGKPVVFNPKEGKMLRQNHWNAYKRGPGRKNPVKEREGDRETLKA